MTPISFVLPPFGSPIPGQGGHLAAILRGPTIEGIEQPPFALLISASAANEFDCHWGEYAVISGANSKTDGWANTQDMLAAQCAAAVCLRESPIDGHNDWYLPSAKELMAAATNVPEMFGKKEYYWSSTQAGRDAYFYETVYHSMSCNVKNRNKGVRPFRQVPLELLTP